MPEQLRRIALLTPYSWGDPHPVNDHVRELAEGLAENAAAGAGPEVLVIAPSRSAAARRRSRRALRRFAQGASPKDVLADAELLDTTGTTAFPVLALGVAIGGASVAMRSSLRLLFERAEIDVVHVHDPLEADLTRSALRRWDGLSVGTFHTAPAPRRVQSPAASHFDRILDLLDLRLVGSVQMQAHVAAAFGGEAAQLRVIEAVAAPGAEHAVTLASSGAGTSSSAPESAAHPVRLAILRGTDDDTIVRALLRELRNWNAPRAIAEVVIVSRYGRYHRPSTPRALKGRLHTVQARTRAEADTAIANADVVVVTDSTPERAVTEARALGLRIVSLEASSATAAVVQKALNQPAPAATPHTSRSSQARQLVNEVENVFARRHPKRKVATHRPRTCLIDLHMHTSHSWDCATDPEALLYAAQKVGLTAVAVTDHNEISGALACAELADEYGIQVIVGEEVKTSEGEVIGLFLTEKIEAGLSWRETIAQIQRQNGIVYVPHPFDRLHTIPDPDTLRDTLDDIDAFEVYNARLPFEQYNREAERFARKYNLIEGAGSDAHVIQGLGTAAVHMPAWDDPESFLMALREGQIIKKPKSLVYLQGLKLLDTVTGRTKQPPSRHAS